MKGDFRRSELQYKDKKEWETLVLIYGSHVYLQMLVKPTR